MLRTRRKCAENAGHVPAQFGFCFRQCATASAAIFDSARKMVPSIFRASFGWAGIVVAMLSWSVAAEAAGRPASLVIDANTGSVISAYNADEPRYPASLTKMMTLYITFDLIQQGRLTESTRIIISPNAASAQPTKLGLEAGRDVALIDAIKSLITLSANDVAIALAEHIAGSEERFAALMTQRARALGMRNTTFKNASGLPNGEQVTTARDMVTLALRLHDDFPKHYALFAMREFHYGGRSHANHNTMLNNYEGTEGIKTGYTAASGFNLVASVKRGPKHVVGAVFGGVTASSRNATMRTLLNMALYKASPDKSRVPATVVARSKPVAEPRIELRQATAGGSRPIYSPTIVADAQAPLSNPATVQAPPPGSGSPGHVEIAQVRPVLVAPRVPRQAVVQVAALPEPQSSVRVSPPIYAPAASPVLTAPVDARLPPITSRSFIEPTKTATANASATPRAAAQAPMGVGLSAATAPAGARGAPPSTFQQQAAELNSGAKPSGPMPVSSPHANTALTAQVEIQIGAYASAAEAENQLNIARSRAADLIGGAAAKTQPAMVNGKSLWRARFTGFQASSAGNVCSELRRRQIDCLVARAE